MRIPKHMAVAASILAFAGSAAFSMIAAEPASAAISATIQARGFDGGFGEGFGRRFRETESPGEDFIAEEGDFFVNEEDGSNPR